MALSKFSSREQLAKFEIGEIHGLDEGKSSGSGSFGVVYYTKSRLAVLHGLQFKRHTIFCWLPISAPLKKTAFEKDFIRSVCI